MCKNSPKKRKPIEDNIGEILMGDRIYSTDYQINVLQDEYCNVLCEFNYDYYQETFLKFLIDNNYNSTYYLDGLPASFINFESNQVEYQGIPLGKKLNNGQYILYNHLTFHIELQIEEDFSFEKTYDSLKTTGNSFLIDAGLISDNSTSRNIDYKDNNDDSSNKEISFSQSKFTIRKFQVTPFSIQHTNENFFLKTKCLKKENMLEELREEYMKQHKELNINYTNYNYQYDDEEEVKINNNTTNNKIPRYPKIEIPYPSINSKENIQFFRDSLIHNYLQKPNYINSVQNSNSTYLTYDIKFTISRKSAKFVSRWDHYLKFNKSKDSIHWWSLINSALAISITSFIVMLIFYRVIRKDIDYAKLVSVSYYYQSIICLFTIICIILLF